MPGVMAGGEGMVVVMGEGEGEGMVGVMGEGEGEGMVGVGWRGESSPPRELWDAVIK